MKLLDVDRIRENIDEVAMYDISSSKAFGSAYYVYCDGSEIEKCYGTKSLNSDCPVTNRTIFRLASMTKPITAVAALILAERGMMSLDDGIDNYLPSFRNIKIRDVQGNVSEPKRIPTVRNILTHSSGIGGVPFSFDLTDRGSFHVATKICQAQPNYRPGTAVEYSYWYI